MTDDSRELGVELGDVRNQLSTYEYPVSKETLLDALGDETLGIGDGTTTVRELISPLTDESYESPEEVEGAIMNMVGEEAIGRKNYSDRTPPAPGEDMQGEPSLDRDGDRQQESF